MPIVFIISAPSGSGKTTLVSRLLKRVPRLKFSVSYTTRRPRNNEKEGENYHFISKEEFEARIGKDEFLEWAKVFGNYYGTHRSALDEACAEDLDLVLDIDVQGAGQLRRKIPAAVSIFILAPSRQVLEQRLRSRSQDSDEVIERRLRDAGREIGNYREYDYVLVNDDLSSSEEILAAIVLAERSNLRRMEERIQPVLESYELGSPD
ncbi:MAG: guanylate kinase [Bryobacteraceae bacterium]